MRLFLLLMSIPGLVLGARILKDDNWKLNREPEECTTRDNYPGRCVYYYQCNQETNTIIKAGASLLDIKSSQCSNAYHVCCRLTDLTATASSKDTSTTPVSGGAGNTKPPAPRDTRKSTNGQGYPGASPLKLDLTPTKTVEPTECTTRDNYPGRCVYYYQCSQTTNTIIEDGSSLLDIRSSRCSDALHVCCRLTDLTATANTSTSTAPVSGDTGNTTPPAPRDTRKPTNGQGYPGASPPKLDLSPTKTVEPTECTTRDNYPGRCVNYYQCNQTTKTIIEDGSSLIDIRSSQCSNALHVCCRLTDLTATASSNDTSTTPVSGAGNTVPPAPRDTRKPANGRPDISPNKLDLTPTRVIEPTECTTRDNYPGRCVNHYQCSQKNNTIIEDGSSLLDIRSSRCSNARYVCCRLTDLTATANTSTSTAPVSGDTGNTTPAPRDTRKPTNGIPDQPPKRNLTPTKSKLQNTNEKNEGYEDERHSCGEEDSSNSSDSSDEDHFFYKYKHRYSPHFY
ncbi:uncharacterized protein [Epargyreus clarus]|uniref:uncharacterized protein isoform X2 n=1 Tax=Epargyreus clarus TaxID=520877 RepID=UPI003C2B3B2F